MDYSSALTVVQVQETEAVGEPPVYEEAPLRGKRPLDWEVTASSTDEVADQMSQQWYIDRKWKQLEAFLFVGLCGSLCPTSESCFQINQGWGIKGFC